MASTNVNDPSSFYTSRMVTLFFFSPTTSISSNGTWIEEKKQASVKYFLNLQSANQWPIFYTKLKIRKEELFDARGYHGYSLVVGYIHDIGYGVIPGWNPSTIWCKVFGD